MNAYELAAVMGIQARPCKTPEGVEVPDKVMIRIPNGQKAQARMQVFCALSGVAPLGMEEGYHFLWATFDRKALEAVKVAPLNLPDAPPSPKLKAAQSAPQAPEGQVWGEDGPEEI